MEVRPGNYLKATVISRTTGMTQGEKGGKL